MNLAAGGPDTIANMQWLCDRCHDPKTKREQAAGRAAAIAQRGTISRRNRDHEPHPGQL